MSTSIKVTAHISTLASTIAEILTFKNVDLENLCQIYEVQRANGCHSMVNFNAYKSHNEHFSSSSHSFRDTDVSSVEKLDQGHRDGIRRWISTVMKIIASVFTLAFTVLEILTCTNFDRDNLHQVHWVQHSQRCRSTVNNNLHKSYNEHFCAISYRLQDVSILNI